ncbi:MAG: pentapeptide repeat-containing protein [Flavobacteriaceae bacterium]|nr:pentapeptide repeat-containing protein [Flavobacteriaceae bacterium]
MIDNYTCEVNFEKIDFFETGIQKGEYDRCTFINCNFENVHASNIEFVECEFVNCNFSNANVKATAFKEVLFDHCKMIGIKFFECDSFLLQFKFTNCQLDFSSFYQLKIPNTHFTNCNLEEVDFTETQLQQAVFDSCNLNKAIFDNTTIERADLRTATNIQINPENNKLKGAKFSKNNIVGLLYKYQISIE